MSKYIGSSAVNLSTTSADVTGNADIDGNLTVGGNLTVSGTTITVDHATAQTVDLGDGDKIRLGADYELQLWSDGTTGQISGDFNHTGSITTDGLTVDGTGKATFGSVNRYIQNPTGTELRIGADNSSGVITAYTNGSEAMRIASDGSVGIGTSSPNTYSGYTTLTLNGTSGSLLDFEVNGTHTGEVYADGTTVFGIQAIGSRALNFKTNNQERMHITSSGNVGIGVVPESWGTGNTVLQIGSAGKFGGSTNTSFVDMLANAYYDSASSRWEYVNSDFATRYMQIDGTHQWYTAASGTADAALTWSEAMRIDSSGNLLVGKTSTSAAVAGVKIGGNFVEATSSGGAGLVLRRLSNDGDMAVFQNSSGSTVGSIGVNNSRPYLTNSINCGIRLANNTLVPTNESGANESAATDLGATDVKWKDLYLSGGAYLGGTGSANKLDDYEEGTFNPSIGFRVSTTGSLSYTRNTFRYIKVGSSVFITGFLTWYQNNFTANSGAMQLQGLPFAFANSQEFRGGVNIVYCDAIFTGVTIYQQGFRNEQAETNMVFNFSDATNGAMDSTITSYTSIPSGGSMMISGTYTTT